MPDGICIYCGKIISDISKNICEECDNINIQKKYKETEYECVKKYNSVNNYMGGDIL